MSTLAAGRPRNDALGVWVCTKSNRWRRRKRHRPQKAAKSDSANSRRMGTTWTATPSGGAFTFVEWKQDQYLQVKRNEKLMFIVLELE